jgi:hypothetical protein
MFSLLQFMTATEDVADEVNRKLARMDPQARAEAKAKAKVRPSGTQQQLLGPKGAPTRQLFW